LLRLFRFERPHLLQPALVSNEAELFVRDLHTEGGRRRAAALGVARVPALAVNGSLAECCRVEPVRIELLRA
jgi:hypothetical protein